MHVMKTCPRCGETKSTDEFHRAAKKADGLQAHCKACRAHGETNPEARVIYTRTRNGKEQTVIRVVAAHGQSRTPLYRRWKAMVGRCTNPAQHNYRWYGGKGVTVCEQWRDDFLAFKTWAESSGFAQDRELDRIDSSKGYEPGNCRWVTKRDNVKSMRTFPLALDQQLAAYAAANGISRAQVIEDALAAYLSTSGRG